MFSKNPAVPGLRGLGGLGTMVRPPWASTSTSVEWPCHGGARWGDGRGVHWVGFASSFAGSVSPGRELLL